MIEQESWADSIRGTSTDDFWIWAIIISCLGIACGYGIFYFIRRARIIQDTPTSKIRSAAQGYVEIIGKVNYLIQQPITAPLTTQACAWFSYEIEEREDDGDDDSGPSWRTIEKKSSDRAFQCEDETGICMVDPRKAEVHPINEDVWYGHSKWPSHGPTVKTGYFSRGDYRYTERRLHSGEPLYALGLFRSVDPNKAHGDVNDETRAILKLWKQDQSTLHEKFDANGDGQIDLNEWQTVRNAAEQKAYQQRLSRSDRPAIHVLSKTDDFRRPFILSVKPQSNMVRGFKLKAAACTVGFVIFGPLALWMLIIRLAN